MTSRHWSVPPRLGSRASGSGSDETGQDLPGCWAAVPSNLKTFLETEALGHGHGPDRLPSARFVTADSQ
jgi:hypothetical protein